MIPLSIKTRERIKIIVAMLIVLTSFWAIGVTYAQDELATTPPTEPVVEESMTPMDIVWTITATGLVFFMQAGFAMLEAGMSRSKNAINVLMKNYTDMAFGSLIFFLLGFGLMFGTNTSGWIGTDTFAPSDLTGSGYTFLVFQLVFAATASTIISGAIAERARYWSYIIVTLIVTGLVYPIFGSWAWGGLFGKGQGWLEKLGFIDFAGSTVVHSVGGWAALAAIIVIGPRLGRFSREGEARDIPGFNLPFMAIGGFILWFGWFGFNGGSTTAASHDIGRIVLNTQLAAAAGVVGVLVTMVITTKRVLLSETVNGGLGGLVGITAGCANVSPISAIMIGLLAGALAHFAAKFLLRLKIDDVVGAVAVHGFCGAWGTLAAGIFNEGDMFNLSIIGVQALGVAAAFIWTFGVSFLIFTLIHRTVGMRASTMHEQRGLDFTEHHEVVFPEFVELLQGK